MMYELVARGWVCVALNYRLSPQATWPAHIVDAKPATARNPGATVVRTYGIGAQILKDLGLKRMRVLSAPKQLQGLAAFDLEVTSYVDGGE